MPSDVPIWVSVPPGASVFGRVDRLRDTKVGYYRDAVREENVLRLDVTVDDSAPVRVIERMGDIGENLYRR